MMVRRMELQGFKTFAAKTVVEFASAGRGQPLVAIIGPNGSGKSNIADAVRWCLGEQSMKSLRGEGSQDVLFSGTSGRARAGFAQVTLVFAAGEREEGVAETSVTRRLFREGESEYLLNGQVCRRIDVQEFLARAGVGERSYAVISQGAIDRVILASPEERKEFFADATGVRAVEVRRSQALRNLVRTAEQLTQIRQILLELTPRRDLLARQARRFADRERVEEQWRASASAYYAAAVGQAQAQVTHWAPLVDAARGEASAAHAQMSALQDQLGAMEQTRHSAAQAQQTQRQQAFAHFQTLNAQLQAARTRVAAAQQEVVLAQTRVREGWAPLPLPMMLEEMGQILRAHEHMLVRLRALDRLDALPAITEEFADVVRKTAQLARELTPPSAETAVINPVLQEELAQAVAATSALQQEVAAAEAALVAADATAASPDATMMALLTQVRGAQARATAADEARHTAELALAREQTTLTARTQEAHEALGAHAAVALAQPAHEGVDLSALAQEMHRTRQRLDALGGIDPEVVEEFRVVEERHAAMTTQLDDLVQAAAGAQRTLAALDEEIRTIAARAFADLNREFGRYFRVLFGGGTARLIQLPLPEQSVPEDDDLTARFRDRAGSALANIDLEATPPGKKLKAISLLSGGERALTALALLCAILAVNPPPFLVLDEVDAALDDANAERFAAILAELRTKTQCIVITHNRATMERADVLYGMTMADDGTTRVVSVQWEDGFDKTPAGAA